LFSRTVIYPSTNYPGRTQEGVLESILRKKLEPPVASWVDEGRETAFNIDTSPAKEKEVEEFWEWTQQWIGTRVAKYVMDEQGDNYTGEERDTGVENVNTGLKRKLDEDEDDESDDEEEDEEMEEVVGTRAAKSGTAQMNLGLGEVTKDPNGKSRSAEDVWRFATIGMVPEPSMGRR
jgi:mediator of RNA polymerase II transcription subunit 8